jgi:hypothetical protein
MRFYNAQNVPLRKCRNAQNFKTHGSYITAFAYLTLGHLAHVHFCNSGVKSTQVEDTHFETRERYQSALEFCVFSDRLLEVLIMIDFP